MRWPKAPAREVAGHVRQKLKASDPRTFIGKGKTAEVRELAHRARRDARDFRRRAQPRAGAQSRKGTQDARDRSQPADPRHLRAARAHARGQAAGRNRAAQLPAPRLTRQWSHLSRQAGGGGACGRPYRHPRSRRNAARSRPPAGARAADSAAPAPGRSRTHALDPAPAPARGSLSHRRAGRLYQLRQIDADERADRSRRRGRGPPVLDARPDHPPPEAARQGERDAGRHGRLYPSPAPHAGRGLQGHARGSAHRRSAAARGRCELAAGRRADGDRRSSAGGNRRGRGAANRGDEQDRPR